MGPGKDFVDKKLASREVLLFTKKYCPASKTACMVMSQYTFTKGSFEHVDIEDRQDCTQIEDYLQILCLSDRREVPQLFVHGKYIGSLDKIVLQHENGELLQIFKDAKVLSQPQTET